MYRPGFEDSDTFYERRPQLTRRGPSLLTENSTSPDVDKYMSPSRQSPSLTSPSRLGTNERKHYNRALKELCKILTLEGQQLEESQIADQSWRDASYQYTNGVTTKGDQMLTSDADADIDTDGLERSLYEEEDSLYKPNTNPKLARRKPRAQDDTLDEDMDKGQANLTQKSMEAVYAELGSISRKLQEQSILLHEREQILQEREQALKEQLEASFAEQDKATQNARREMMRRFKILQEEHKAEIVKMEEILKDKTRENKRIKSSFDTLKQANDMLRQQLDELQVQNKKLETSAISVQHRLTNLQRWQELSERQKTIDTVSAKAKAETQKRVAKEMGESKGASVGKQQIKPNIQVYSVLGTLLEWVSDVHLMHLPTDPTKPLDSLPAPTLTHERCVKVLPALVDVLHHLPALSTSKIHLPCLQFIYWSIIHVDTGQGSQRTSLSATYRRLGEELYKPSIAKPSSEDGKDLMAGSSSGEVLMLNRMISLFVVDGHILSASFIPILLHLYSQRTSLSATYRRLGEELYKPTIAKSSDDGKDLMAGSSSVEKSKAAIFFRSPNLHIRFLSSLIILRTLSQVDYLAQIFDTLKSDLKDERSKELFLTYHATQVIIPHMKATHRALVGSVVDICLQMSMESMLMQQFLDSCSTEVWFRACSTMLHMPKLDVKIWEKLSIVLQKLSKIKTNKRYFEVLGISSAVQEMIHKAGPENAFLSLNLRSILFNLSGGKGSPPQQTYL